MVAVDPKRTEEMDRLRSRLAALKAEQAEADKAREQAWKQLKEVVQDLSKLGSSSDSKTPTS